MSFIIRILADILNWIILLAVFLFFAKFCFDPGKAPWTRAGRPPEEEQDNDSSGGKPPESHDDTEAET